MQLQDKNIMTDIRQKFEELCEEYGEAFSKNNEDIGRTKLVKMDIDTGDSPPVSSRPYTLPLKHYEWVQREIESLECAGVITKSMSKWASPIVVVPKKSAPGEPPKRRLCVDFRKVNELQQVITAEKTKGQISIHLLPKIDEMYAKLKDVKVFSTIDLRSGYHHIALGKSSRAKTAFVTPFGKYEFLMVPFRLAQAPAYFQLLMNKVLKGLKFAMTYLDDIIIFSQDELQHLEHLEVVFSRLREAGLKMKHSKCDFFKCEIHYLGHLISPEGISPLPNKIFRPSLQPMDFICMDLIGEFHPPTSRGHRYALTAVCMLTGFTWCVPLKTKTVEEVTKAYMDHIYSNFGGSIKILTDNGTEFKNKLFKEVVKN